MSFKRPIKDEPITWKFVCDVCKTERDPLNMWCNHKLPDGSIITEKEKTKIKIMTVREGSIFTPVVVNTIDLPNTDYIIPDVEYVLLAISLGKFDNIRHILGSPNILKSINNLKNLYNTGLTRLNFNFDIGRHFCIVYPTLANIRYAEADYL